MKRLGGDGFLFCGVKFKMLSQLLTPETRRRLLDMAREHRSDTSRQTAARGEEPGAENQVSPSVIKILYDSMTEEEEQEQRQEQRQEQEEQEEQEQEQEQQQQEKEQEDEERPKLVQMEEKVFVSGLHSFMKDRGTPIERIPHLGFRQIDLWRIYKAVEKLGGYDSVTSRRLWKKVYDELGGSPGSTSAATCTRRHYEKLVLPFERQTKGEEDRPLPPSKLRKPYKRNVDGKVAKAEKKRKRSPSDREMDSEIEIHGERSPEAACWSEAVMPPPPWVAPSDGPRPDRSVPNRASAGLCTSVSAHLAPAPPSSPWTAPLPPAAGEVISPLEKKKRMAQASLNLPLNPPRAEDKERPSVIRRSPSPARASSGQNCDSSDSSPLPSSPSSSRSPSPYSVSSEDGPEGNRDYPASGSQLSPNCTSAVKNTPSGSEERKCGQIPKDPARQNKDISSQSTDSIKVQSKDSDWMPLHKGRGKYSSQTFQSFSSSTVRSDWASTSTSSFTKVIPESVQLLRPAPIRPGYKTQPGRATPRDESPTCAKRLTDTASWLYPTEKREKPRTMQQKVPPPQHGPAHSPAGLPVSSCDKPARYSRHQPLLHPFFLPNRMRLPQSQLIYRHVPMSPGHSALVGSVVYPYPYYFPLINPQTGYARPAMHPFYPHKL